MKKEFYEQPEMKVVEIESASIIAESNTEQLGDGGSIFGNNVKGLDIDDDWMIN